MIQQKEALRILEESLKELESSKGSVLSAVQKLSRASEITNKPEIRAWCAIQLGDTMYTEPLNELITALLKNPDPNSESYKKTIPKLIKPLDELELKHEIHYIPEELEIKSEQSGGGYSNIGFIEERYADLVRTKRGNDGTYYKINLNKHINYVRKKAHEFASSIFNQVKFSGTTRNCFDLLKEAADDRLLDLNPSLAEQLMLAFKSVSSEKEEEWSQALTTCRRLLEGIADEIYPARDTKINGRPLNQSNYINRIWAFMDESINSSSNKELAKTHIDYLGAWIEKTNKITNKGVHADMGRLEAVKAVFHTYLVVADLLDHLDKPKTSTKKKGINSASIDELEALLNIPRSTAKEIIKARVQQGHLDPNSLSKIRGVGQKTLEKALEEFSFN